MPSTPPQSPSSILLPSPATTPNRKRLTMSFRNNTYANHSPTLATVASFGGSYLSSPTSSPTSSPLSSPTSAVDGRDRDQLVTHKRDPAKAAAANRSATLENRWGGRRLSEVVEEGPYDDREAKKKNASISVFTHPTIYLKRYRSRRYLLYFLGALTLYYTLLRPLFSSFGPATPPLGSSSAGSQAKAKPTAIIPNLTVKIPPLRARAKVPDRARLPQSVLFQDLPDHPIERGMLKVNPASQVHPIYQLIRDARIAWDQKVANQSKSLQDAVTEYERRYHQLPPKGFDKWWDYVW